MTDLPSMDPAALLERLKGHLDKTGGAIVVSRSKQGDYIAGSEWGQEADDSPMAGGASYGMGATPMKALHDMLTEAGA